jgi:glutamine cyclotransferase
MTRLAYWLFALSLMAATAASAEPGTIKVIERKPLSRDLFTQGLEFHNGKLYLSSGLYGQSRLLRMDPGDGRVLARQDLDSRLFAEGLTVLHDRIYQLTWRSGFMLVYDKASLAPVAAWPIAGEGWGLTNNGSELIASDGSDKLTFLSASDGRALRRIRVSANGRPVNRLNELEWIDQRIWANVWHTDRIVIIHPDTGHVEA